MAAPQQVFLLSCPLCSARFTQTGQIVGGDSNCEHKFESIVATSPRPPIVYPTDAERKWLRIIDQNKAENATHLTKFESDLITLSQNKSTALKAIATQIASLKEALENRRDQLEQELCDAFDERKTVIEANMTELGAHSVANEEAKDSAEELLISDQPIAERTKAIVGSCEGIINSTPKLNFVETELRYSFDQFQRIESKLKAFGLLHSMPVGAGKRCLFASTNAATKAPALSPKEVALPTVTFKSTTFDDAKQRVKLTFKIKDLDAQTVDGLERVSDHLFIHVFAKLDDEEEEDEKAGGVEQPLFEGSVKFTTDCAQNGKKWEMLVDHAFAEGITVAFKMKAKFVSPDTAKFKSTEGEWSREQTYEIPAAKADEEEKSAIESAVTAAVSIPPMAYAPAQNGHQPGMNGGDQKEKAKKEVSQEKKKGQISVLILFQEVKKRVVLKFNSKKDIDDYKMAVLIERVAKKFKNKGLDGHFTLKTEAGQAIATDQDIIDVLENTKDLILLITQ